MTSDAVPRGPSPRGAGAGADVECSGPTCITCSDAAEAVTVVELLDDDLASVRTDAGTTEQVSVALVDAAVGDVVLVHAGEAIGMSDRP